MGVNLKGLTDMTKIDKWVKTNDLLMIYGPVLTRHQFEIMSLRYADDLSYGEVAENFGTTRQAVLNTAKKGLGKLLEYETCLGDLERDHRLKDFFGKAFFDTNARSAIYEVLA